MANQRLYSAPKRNVKRVRKVLMETFTESGIDKGVYTVSERETLIRSILQFNLRNVSKNGQDAFSLEVIIQRKGQDFDTPVEFGDANFSSPPGESLWLGQWSWPLTESADSIRDPYMVDVDLHSMRKLLPGDVIYLRGITNDAVADITVNGVMTFFLKEK